MAGHRKRHYTCDGKTQHIVDDLRLAEGKMGDFHKGLRAAIGGVQNEIHSHHGAHPYADKRDADREHNAAGKQAWIMAKPEEIKPQHEVKQVDKATECKGKRNLKSDFDIERSKHQNLNKDIDAV